MEENRAERGAVLRVERSVRRAASVDEEVHIGERFELRRRRGDGVREDCVVFDFDANARSEGDSSAVWEGEVERVCFERGPRDCVFHSKHVDAVRIPLRRPGVIQLLESNENHMDRVVRVRRVWDKTDIRSVLESIRVDVSERDFTNQRDFRTSGRRAKIVGIERRRKRSGREWHDGNCGGRVREIFRGNCRNRGVLFEWTRKHEHSNFAASVATIRASVDD